MVLCAFHSDVRWVCKCKIEWDNTFMDTRKKFTGKREGKTKWDLMEDNIDYSLENNSV